MKKITLSLLPLLALGTGLWAQDVSGTTEGLVLDPTGAGVPKARITVTSTDRNLVVRTLETDTAGNYSAPDIPIGNYVLRVEAGGFRTATVTGIVLNVRDDLKINIDLQVGKSQKP
jgi:hypothetical protein